MNLYIDIETVPAHQDLHELIKEIHRKKVLNGRKIGRFEEYLAQTSFDGAFGRIICIGVAIDDEPVKILSGQEKEILQEFWKIARDADLFIGFNCMDFDLRFIYQRSIITGVKPSRQLSFARYRNNPIYDIMWEWRKWAKDPSVSLDSLAKALGIQSSKGGDIEGKNVAKAYQEGKLKEICDYCAKDVEVTRKIYRRLVFEG